MRWPFRRRQPRVAALPPSTPDRDWARLPALHATVDLAPPALAPVLRLPEVSGTRPLPGRTDDQPVSAVPRGRVTGLARLRPITRPILAHRAGPDPTDPGLDPEPEFAPEWEFEAEPVLGTAPKPHSDPASVPEFESVPVARSESVPVVRHVSPAVAAVARPALVPHRTARAVSRPAVDRPVLTKAVDDYVGEARESLVPHRTTELDRLFHQQEALGTDDTNMLALALAGYTSSVAAPPPRADDPGPTPRPSATERARRRATLAQSRRLGLTARATPTPEPPDDASEPHETEPPNDSAPVDSAPVDTAPVDTAPIDTEPATAAAPPDVPPVLDAPVVTATVPSIVSASVAAASAKTPPGAVVPVAAAPVAAVPVEIPPVVGVPAPIESEPVPDHHSVTAPVTSITAAPAPHRPGPVRPTAHPIPPATGQPPPRRLGLGAPLTGPPPRSQPRPPDPAPQVVPEPEPDTVDVPQDVTDTFRSAFGIDVGNVAVHRGSAVTEQARSVSARAFTRHGEVYLPEPAGHLDEPVTKALLAHELVHAAQQRALGAGLPPEESAAGAELEAEAVATEHWFLGAGPTPTALVHRPTAAPPQEPPTTPVPQRSPHLHPPAPPPLTPPPFVAPPPAASPLSPPPIERPPDATALTWQPPDVLPPAVPTTEQPAPPSPETPDLAQLKETVARLAHTVTELDSRRSKPPTPRELDDLAHGLYRRIRGNLRRELLVDRERAGRLADLR